MAGGGVDATWQRLRDFASAEGRRSGRRAGLAVLVEPISVPEASAAEELAHALCDAGGTGILEPIEGWLVFVSRVRGDGVEDLAAALGPQPRWLWRRRVRAEQLLAGTGRCWRRDDGDLGPRQRRRLVGGRRHHLVGVRRGGALGATVGQSAAGRTDLPTSWPFPSASAPPWRPLSGCPRAPLIRRPPGRRPPRSYCRDRCSTGSAPWSPLWPWWRRCSWATTSSLAQARGPSDVVAWAWTLGPAWPRLGISLPWWCRDRARGGSSWVG